MRIGFCTYGSSPESGGSYTFEEQVEQQLFTKGQSLQNEYVRLRDFLPSSVLHVPFARQLDRLERGVRHAICAFGGTIEAHTTWRWRQAIRAARIDAIWSCGPHVPIRELPYAIHVWDIQHRRQPFFPEVSADGEWGLRERFTKTLVQRACMVFTGTQTGTDELVRYYGVEPTRLHIVPHPTPLIRTWTSEIELEKAARQNQDRWGPYLFYPAQFWAHKNHICLVDMLSSLNDNGHRYHLVLSGSDKGNQRHVLEYARKVGVINQVTSLGFVERARLPGLYRGAHALVYPTLFGPENLPPLEAFEMQCPVIASRVAGADEQLGDAAMLVSPTAASEYAQAVIQLQDPQIRAELVRKGSELVRHNKPADFVQKVDAAFSEFGPLRRTWQAPSE